MKSEKEDIVHETPDGKYVIVVGREYGSGGRRIAKMLADRLGIGYYDKTLLTEASRNMGYLSDIIERSDERRPSFLRSMLSFNYGAPTANIGGTMVSPEKIYEIQSRVIREICGRESCVIVGRTADYVMRGHPRMLSLFIHAPIEARAAAIIKRGETGDKSQAAAIALKNDNSRESYYNYYTNRSSWGKASNYDLSFDSTRIDDEMIVSIVKNMLGVG